MCIRDSTRKRSGLSGNLEERAWLCPHSIFTCTMIFKTRDILDYIDSGVLDVDIKAGDYAMFLYLAQKGEVKYLDHSTAVYRTAHGSLMNNQDKSVLIDFQVKNFNLLNFYFSYFDVNPEIQSKVYLKLNKELRRRVYLYSADTEIVKYREYYSWFDYKVIIFLRLIGIHKLKLNYFGFKSFIKHLILYKKINVS